jgi:hypothetical protein
MPILGINKEEAALLTDYLLEGVGKKPNALRALADRLFPPQNLRRRHLALFFTGGFVAGGAALGSVVLLAAWIRRRRPKSRDLGPRAKVVGAEAS